MQLCTGTGDFTSMLERSFIGKIQHMRPDLLARQGVRQAARLVLAAGEQVRHRHPVVIAGQRATFQTRKREQIFDQMPHTLGLLGHQLQIAVALILF